MLNCNHETPTLSWARPIHLNPSIVRPKWGTKTSIDESFDYYDYYWFLLILQYYDGTRPLLVSRFALDRSVAMGGRPKCRPIRLLSGWIPLYAPTVSCRGGQLISTHAYAETPHVIGHLFPRHLPLPRKQLSRTLLPGLCYRLGTAGRCPRWWLSGGHVSGERANAQHALRI